LRLRNRRCQSCSLQTGRRPAKLTEKIPFLSLYTKMGLLHVTLRATAPFLCHADSVGNYHQTYLYVLLDNPYDSAHAKIAINKDGDLLTNQYNIRTPRQFISSGNTSSLDLLLLLTWCKMLFFNNCSISSCPLSADKSSF
ncbi:MAG: hypothetical protein J6H31_01725, partial [Butyrivibrio sp.]|nr:hypothetical protein [Butyrivibrio sp.]